MPLLTFVAVRIASTRREYERFVRAAGLPALGDIDRAAWKPASKRRFRTREWRLYTNGGYRGVVMNDGGRSTIVL
jgi:hypothetical protein